MLQLQTSKVRSLLFLGLVILGFLIPHAAYALSLSPARIEVTGDPGQVISTTFLVVNDEKVTKTSYVSYENFESQGESGTPNFVVAKDGLATWIAPVDKIVLAPNESKSIPVTISIPKDATAGGNFAGIFLSSNPPTSGAASTVSVGAKVGILLLLRINGDIKEGGGIVGFTSNASGHLKTELPVDFVYRFKNTGGDRVMPTGQISIKNMFGLRTKVLPANQSQGNILPDSIRRFNVTWNAGSSGPVGTARAQGADAYWLFVIPWQLLIVVFVVGFLFRFLFSKGLKAYDRKIIERYNKK
jgi:hypothetical protein